MRGITFSITLPDPVEQKLKEYANNLGVSRSAAARFIIVDHFNDKKREESNVAFKEDETKHS